MAALLAWQITHSLPVALAIGQLHAHAAVRLVLVTCHAQAAPVDAMALQSRVATSRPAITVETAAIAVALSVRAAVAVHRHP